MSMRSYTCKEVTKMFLWRLVSNSHDLGEL